MAFARHTGVSPRGRLWTKKISVGSLWAPGPAQPPLRPIAISTHLRRIPGTPALIYIVPGRDTSSLFGNVPRKGVSTLLPEVNFSLRFHSVNTSQRSIILNTRSSSSFFRTLIEANSHYCTLSESNFLSLSFVSLPPLMHT